MVVICCVLGAVLILAYATVCKWDNRRRDKAGIPEGFDHAYEDDLTDRTVSQTRSFLLLSTLSLERRSIDHLLQNPQFRYII